MPEPAPILRAEGIGKSFGRRPVLKSASLWAVPGRITTLLGRNGSGKTTLMRIAVGALRADRGVVAFRGEVQLRPSLARMARSGLMYLPQDQLVSPGYTVREHTDALAASFGRAGVAEVFSRPELAPLLARRVSTLSGGERMRVSLGLALARAPTVLVADEPLLGLAPKDQEALGRELRALAEAGTAVVTSGHDARALLDVSDTILWCVAGTTHHLGTPARAMASHAFRRDYLGPGFGA